MSSNNQLIILRNPNRKRHKFEVHENACVDNGFKASKKTLLKSFEKLEQAIDYADKYCNEYPYVEYGYFIDLGEGK